MQLSLDWWLQEKQLAHQFMVRIASVPILFSILLCLGELVQIGFRRSISQANYLSFFLSSTTSCIMSLQILYAYLFWTHIGQKQKPLEKDAGERTIAWLDKLRNSNGSLPTSNIRLNMQRVMQNNAAVFRTQETLEEGIFGQAGFLFLVWTWHNGALWRHFHSLFHTILCGILVRSVLLK